MTTRARAISIRAHFGSGRSDDALDVLYFALIDGDPLGSGVEPSAQGGYARLAVANDAALWGSLASDAVSVTTAADLSWPAATGVWSALSVSHWAVYDNAAGGDLVYSGTLAESIAPTGAGDVPRILAGGLTIEQR